MPYIQLNVVTSIAKRDQIAAGKKRQLEQEANDAGHWNRRFSRPTWVVKYGEGTPQYCGKKGYSQGQNEL
jgi:hypothetical protein